MARLLQLGELVIGQAWMKSCISYLIYVLGREVVIVSDLSAYCDLRLKHFGQLLSGNVLTTGFIIPWTCTL